ncbi:MAG: hypothetical protein ACRC62_30240 [Microcoleus sp.]
MIQLDVIQLDVIQLDVIQLDVIQLDVIQLDVIQLDRRLFVSRVLRLAVLGHRLTFPAQQNWLSSHTNL